MEIRVILFARLRELAAKVPERLALAEGASVADAWAQLAEGNDELARLRAVVQAARNQRHVTWDEPLADGDELAFFPPVSGGSGHEHDPNEPDDIDPDSIDEVWVGTAPISQEDPPLPDEETGAVVRFLGAVRGTFQETITDAGPGEAALGAPQPITRMRYEVYDGMAESELAAIAREARERFGVRNLRILHRVGDVAVGEVSLLVSVVGSHRKEAFAACGWIVDAIKERVPIWKKELLIDGERWV